MPRTRPLGTRTHRGRTARNTRDPRADPERMDHGRTDPRRPRRGTRVIVADVNLLVYLLINGPFTSDAERAFARDRRWIAPQSHRFELLNVLSTNVRAGTNRISGRRR